MEEDLAEGPLVTSLVKQIRELNETVYFLSSDAKLLENEKNILNDKLKKSKEYNLLSRSLINYYDSVHKGTSAQYDEIERNFANIVCFYLIYSSLYVYHNTDLNFISVLKFIFDTCVMYFVLKRLIVKPYKELIKVNNIKDDKIVLKIKHDIANADQ